MATPYVRMAVASGRSRSFALLTELERQVGTLVRRGLPQLCGIGVAELVAVFAPLRDVVARIAPPPRASGAEAPFVVVPPRSLVSTVDAMRGVRHRGLPGVSHLLLRAKPRSTPALAHVAIGVACGSGDDDRAPLTVDEGIALATRFPEMVPRADGLVLVDPSGLRAVLRMDDRGPTLAAAPVGSTSPANASCRERSVGHGG